MIVWERFICNVFRNILYVGSFTKFIFLVGDGVGTLVGRTVSPCLEGVDVTGCKVGEDDGNEDGALVVGCDVGTVDGWEDGGVAG